MPKVRHEDIRWTVGEVAIDARAQCPDAEIQQYAIRVRCRHPRTWPRIWPRLVGDRDVQVPVTVEVPERDQRGAGRERVMDRRGVRATSEVTPHVEHAVRLFDADHVRQPVTVEIADRERPRRRRDRCRQHRPGRRGRHRVEHWRSRDYDGRSIPRRGGALRVHERRRVTAARGASHRTTRACAARSPRVRPEHQFERRSRPARDFREVQPQRRVAADGLVGMRGGRAHERRAHRKAERPDHSGPIRFPYNGRHPDTSFLFGPHHRIQTMRRRCAVPAVTSRAQ